MREQRGIGPTEGLSRRIRIPDQRQLQARDTPCERGEQPQPGMGQLLGIVDDEQPQGLRKVGREVVVVGQGSRRRPKEPCGVDRPGTRQRRDLVVLREDGGRGHPFGAIALLAKMGQQGRADVKLDGPHEQVTQLLPEATRPHRAGAARWPDRSGPDSSRGVGAPRAAAAAARIPKPSEGRVRASGDVEVPPIAVVIWERSRSAA